MNPWNRRLVPSVLAGAAVAATAYAVTLLAWILLNQLQLSVVPSVAEQYWPAGIIAFVVIGLAGLFGALERRLLALAAGAAAAVIAFFLSILAFAGVGGFVYIVQYLGIYVPFILALLVATPTLGALVYTAWERRRPRRGRVALVRAPSVSLADGLVQGERMPVDTALADDQWDAYVAAFTDAGWQTIEVEPADRMPDGVFVEDTAVVLGPRVALITRPGAESRRAETQSTADALRRLGFTLYDLEAPATLDGGDVLQVGDTIYVGRSSRTNAEGIRQLRELVAELPGHTRVVAVPVTEGLHLKGAASALPDGTVLVYPPALENSRLFDRCLAVPEPQGANVVALSADTVLVRASAPKTAALIEDLGYRVVTVDLSEFEKLDGATTCLSIRVE